MVFDSYSTSQGDSQNSWPRPAMLAEPLKRGLTVPRACQAKPAGQLVEFFL